MKTSKKFLNNLLSGKLQLDKAVICILVCIFFSYAATTQGQHTAIQTVGRNMDRHKEIKTSIDIALKNIDEIDHLKRKNYQGEIENAEIKDKYSDISRRHDEVTKYNRQLLAKIGVTQEKLNKAREDKQNQANQIKKLREEYDSLCVAHADIKLKFNELEIQVGKLEKENAEFKRVNGILMERQKVDRNASMQSNRIYLDRTLPYGEVEFPTNVQFDLFYYPIYGEQFDIGKANAYPNKIKAKIHIRRLANKQIIGTFEVDMDIEIRGNGVYYRSDLTKDYKAQGIIAEQSQNEKCIYTIEVNRYEIYESIEFTLKRKAFHPPRKK